MESKQPDPVSFYKNLEKEWNKQIHLSVNCLTFTHSFGKAVEYHLDQVVIRQKVINNWLTVFDIPKKDDFAHIAERIVDCEEKLDNLEENLYLLNTGLKNNHSQLKELNTSLRGMLSFIENEVKDLNVNKIKSLKNELEELKRLFDN
jgi:predicted nuclease with TOPRIM domain